MSARRDYSVKALETARPRAVSQGVAAICAHGLRAGRVQANVV